MLGFLTSTQLTTANTASPINQRSKSHRRKQLTPNTKGEIIPTHILIQPPSAELKPGQLDQDSLPPYDVLDDILYRYIDEHQSQADIVAAGHDGAIVSRVLGLVKRAEFKRQQAAPGLKITDRAFGTGWRMPIASQWE